MTKARKIKVEWIAEGKTFEAEVKSDTHYLITLPIEARMALEERADDDDRFITQQIVNILRKAIWRR
tara:strand:- start:1612 stop:1812 length:201 start_codon:yes stop_codon:yes gene_type:complete